MVWLGEEPTDEQIEAAAKAWMSWQFPGRSWDEAVPSMKDMFRAGAKKALFAVVEVTLGKKGCA